MYKPTYNNISKERVIQLLRALVSIKSPYFHEHEIMEFTNSWLNEHGVPAKIHSYCDDVATNFCGENVCGCIDSGKPGHISAKAGQNPNMTDILKTDICMVSEVLI